MKLEGYVDEIRAGMVHGWAIDREHPERPARVDAIINGQRVATLEAAGYREDLAAAGIADGHAAFEFIPTAYCKEPREVRVVYAGTDTVLPNGAAVLQAGAATIVADGSNPWDRDEGFSYAEMWLGAEECQKRINRVISGDEKTGWLPYAIAGPMAMATGKAPSNKPLSEYRCLILGANEGHIERDLFQAGFTGKIVASDIAAKALARARERSAAIGCHNVEYVVADLNRDAFAGPFDFVIAEGVLHHIAEIDKCLRMIERALTPEGRLIMVEFEGPFRFQLPELQVRWINAALAAVPRGLRPISSPKRWFGGAPAANEAIFPATPKENAAICYSAPSEAAIRAFDPSEALSGPAIKRLMPELFSLVERKGFGGTLLSYMTQHFDFKRSNTDPFARAWLLALMKIEETVISTGILDDEFVFYVAAKKRA